MERRTLLKVLSISAGTPDALVHAALQCSSTGADTTFENYRFAFFTTEEQALVERLMELVIPTDDHSPGARAARVPAFADMMLARGPERTKTLWRNGLQLFKTTPEEALAKAAAEEDAPKTEAARFFVALKRMTVDGYYTSKIGIEQELRYEGNQHLMAAPGCTHPEHGG